MDTPTTVQGDMKLRGKRALRMLLQLAIILAVLAVLYWIGHSINVGLGKNGIGFSLRFLTQPAGFDISEGVTLDFGGLGPLVRDFLSSDSNIQALMTGAINAIKAALLGMFFATVLGVLIGVGRLSKNWLLRQLSFLFVEFIRNTPPLIQLVFWYFAVVLQLPGLAQAGQWFGVIASQQGVYLPTISLNDGVSLVSLSLLVLGALCLVAWLVLSRWKMRFYLLLAAPVFFLIAQYVGAPLALDLPQAKRFSVVGGYSISPELAAMLLGLIIYKAAFIAEIVRGAMLSLPAGQWEAAQALGMSHRDCLRDVILPQVNRIVLPAFGNQYISLAKNTSLGIAIGFPDLFNVYGTVANQSGRSLEGMIVVVLAYLVLSWSISAVVNVCNYRLLKAGGAS
ncbi:MAG: ABC transporter permease subunit [Burkholderiaceae bacterium]|nr:ABC transporter permease subunit [Burkholderiaceae bacterium]